MSEESAETDAEFMKAAREKKELRGYDELV